MKLNHNETDAIEMKRNGKLLVQMMTAFMLLVIVPGVALATTMIHNSTTLGSTKHGGSWGVVGGKYGEFTCGTCHAKNTGNIKRVKKVITAPNGVDQFPIEADPTPPAGGITFMDTREGTSDFGDDSRADKTQSSNVCEACHTYDASQTIGVKFHGYDMSGPGDVDHYNRADCMICHPHNQGFKPLDCTACHGYPPSTIDNDGSTTTGLAHNPQTTGSTTAGAHITHATTLGYSCENCHNGYTMPVVSTVNAPFSDISISFNNFGVTTGSYTGLAGLSYNDVLGTGGQNCNNVYCHSTGQSADGTSATPSAYASPTWSTPASGDCGTCHNAADPGTGSHTAHINDGAGCNSCHNDAVASTTIPTGIHVNGSINVYNSAAGDLGYTADGAPGNGYGTCNAASCHDDGTGSLVTTPTWGTASACNECHAQAPTTGSHTDHLAIYSCGDCHTGTTQGTTAGLGHRDGDIDTAASTGLTANKAIGSAYTSCSTNICHGSGSPIWGTDLDGNDACTQCHGELVAGPATDAQKAPGGAGVDTNGDSAATDAQVGAHQIHLNPTISAVVACSACHTVPAAITDAGHIDSALPAEVTFSGLALGGLDGQATVVPTGCATTYCHDGAAIKNGWDGGTLAPTWTDTTFIQGAAADCDNCHGYPPPAAHPANSDCSVCHDVLNADDVTFTAAGKLTHVDGIVQASGGDSCTDCHAADIDGALNGAHAAHTDTATFLTGKTLSGGDYGGTNWYNSAYVGGKPNFGCGQCHPAAEGVNHPINGLNVDIDQLASTVLKERNNATTDLTLTLRTNVTCGSVYCHSDGQATATFQTTPDWYGGTLPTDGTQCASCHGNSPSSGPHAEHAVGIHYQTLYNGAGGLMASSGTAGSGAAHGDSGTSDTISCYTCHNDTVAVEYNASNSTCSGCHSDTNTPATGNEVMVISTAGSTHVNGQADVVFSSLASFKSKAQVRDDITTVAELNNNWTRTNGYKANNSFDASKVATPSYAGGSCSNVSCHNGINTPTWSTGFVANCRACHIDLPQ